MLLSRLRAAFDKEATMKTILKILLICGTLTSIVFAQQKTLQRRYVPVVQNLAAPPLFGIAVGEWSAFSYDGSANVWRSVPFQFDQLTDKGKYDKNSDGIADATDELIFLSKDAGDKAEPWAWLEDGATQQFSRIELEFTDPLQPDEKAWIYLYKNVDRPAQSVNYLNYSPGPAGTPAADTIKTNAYVLGHDKNGWIDYLTLADGGVDIIDRFKLRLAGKGFLIPAYEINEEFVEAETGVDAVDYFPGPVRSYHETKAAILIEKLNLPLLPKKSDFKYNYQYTPNSFQITAETDINSSMLALFGVKTIRQSLDFNENAADMKVFSLNNTGGLVVDGATDPYDSGIDNASSQNWVMVAGENGAVLLIVDISLMKNSQRLLYYADDATSASLPDGTTDTGDLRSYGDMGIMLKATGDALITDKLTIKFKGYFIDVPNLDADFGNKLFAWEQNPLDMTASEQAYTPTFVAERRDASPDEFYLGFAYPNPYSWSTGGHIHFEFFGIKNGIYDLLVYNVLGQRVAAINSIRAETNELRSLKWDGRDLNGEPLPPGVYFYQLVNGALAQTRKLVISH